MNKIKQINQILALKTHKELIDQVCFIYLMAYVPQEATEAFHLL